MEWVKVGDGVEVSGEELCVGSGDWRSGRWCEMEWMEMCVYVLF